jgi:predicted TPR repeat methyltransferase
MRWFRLGSAKRIAGDDLGALLAYERRLQFDPAAALMRKAVEQLRRSLGR